MTRVVNIRTGEPYDVSIMRPSVWGNPFKTRKHTIEAHQRVVEMFREYLNGNPGLVLAAKRDLKDKVLGCCCKPLPCHGDVWIEILDGKDVTP